MNLERFDIGTPIGVIADTHGTLWDEALPLLEDCELILHLGDVGKPFILKRLAEMAELLVVRGNIDTQDWTETTPWTLDILVNGWRLHLVHNIADFNTDISCDAVLHGHSHKPRNEWRDGRLWFNPGGGGRRRFTLPITLGKLWADERGLRGAVVHLPLDADKNHAATRSR
ncbi:metallophosphoesterase family protein [Pistricoccus aurantiacus]|uniref:Phosphoesterase n=1 Tax=Pistricoccus aurantiacus TaxID=1883414 RepID=A0A5B8SKT3_9GAMM|nr:metallophosphoesterase family protein [Pistricoccus aurantiacus]QEA37692.1 metallophosphoesterase family protein [Pistricoccus aurantiacus]